jgi:hypothetical protein
MSRFMASVGPFLGLPARQGPAQSAQLGDLAGGALVQYGVE